MAGDNVEVKYTPGEFYTWDNANISWEGPKADKEWDIFGNKGILDIIVSEDIQITSKYYLTFSILFTEKLFINDFNFEEPNIVLNDLEISETTIGDEDFANLSGNVSPLGYEESRPLFPGEYTYKEAIVGIQMRASLTEARLGFFGAKLNVDVQDVVDRGKVEVLTVDINNPLRVKFTKKFYVPPEEIMFNVISADEPCWVDVLSKTDEYFDIVLRANADRSKLVTGTVSWLATGY